MSSILSVLGLVLAFVSVGQATLTSGNYGVTYDVTYGKEYADSAAFCGAWHTACVNFVGPLGQHHRLTCDATVKGPQIKVYCGGIWKNADGTWSNNQKPIDHTKEAAAAGKVDVTFGGSSGGNAAASISSSPSSSAARTSSSSASTSSATSSTKASASAKVHAVSASAKSSSIASSTVSTSSATSTSTSASALAASASASTNLAPVTTGSAPSVRLSGSVAILPLIFAAIAFL